MCRIVGILQVVEPEMQVGEAAKVNCILGIGWVTVFGEMEGIPALFGAEAWHWDMQIPVVCRKRF